ncbi:hypothetical protein BCR43DRAFT_380993 [Syncephalastrum racemosum]|uniref:SUR7/PalI family-domain-containing protein n=1 Tax=Syncephalastrum racemosum TaxID=13706 RepID=A0A1X2H556_SYNRA|nr:hypothetical protein BCR43DRAFT_380993 [Syncephalastrum racemosum]
MGSTNRAHYFGLFLALAALALLLIANLGTTFASTFLPDVYLVRVDQIKTSQSIRYGPYSSCVYKNGDNRTCTPTTLLYSIDINQLAGINNINLAADSALNSQVSQFTDGKLATQKAGVLLLPAAVLAFVAWVGGMMMRRMRRNNFLPFVGAASCFVGCLCAAATCGCIIVTYQAVFEALATKVDGFQYHWGTSIYLTGAGCACLLFGCICYVSSCCSRRKARTRGGEYEEYYIETQSECASVSLPPHEQYNRQQEQRVHFY